MAALDRFRQAQNDPHSGFAAALAEIRGGGKRGHWIWYVFPQLSGLGFSEMSEHYAIANRSEAEAYLRDPVLRPRLEEITTAVAEQLRRGVPVTVVMGSRTDAIKLVSSLTLFGTVARTMATSDPGLQTFADTANEVLDAAETQGFERCTYTSAQLLDGRKSR